MFKKIFLIIKRRLNSEKDAKMIITIAGEAGSGKTTTGKSLARYLGYDFYSMGDLRGKIAAERGMTIDELNKLGEKEGWTDSIVDDYQKELGKKEDNFVIEGRLSWYFIPHSKKIFLDVAPMIGAYRIFLDPREDEKEASTIDDMIKYIEQRKKSDIKRYKKKPGVNPYDKQRYEIVIDTSLKKPEEVVKEILKRVV